MYQDNDQVCEPISKFLMNMRRGALFIVEYDVTVSVSQGTDQACMQTAHDRHFIIIL